MTTISLTVACGPKWPWCRRRVTGAQSAALYFAVSLTFTLPGQQLATAGLQEAVLLL